MMMKKSWQPGKKYHPAFWQWQKETPVAILEENELPVWGNASDTVSAVKAMGASMVRYPAIRWGVHSYDSSEFLPKYPGLGNRDLFGEIFTEMKKNSIKVMAYCHYGVLHRHAAEMHPEWLAKDAGGSPARWNGKDHHYRSCMVNNDFVHHMRKAIHELCSKYPIDTLYLDGPTFYGECYCEHCRKRYRRTYGEDMPDRLSFENGSRQKNNRLRDAAVSGIVKDLKKELSEFPELPILFNMTMRYHPIHGCGIPEETVKWAQGGNTTEVHRPGSFWTMLQSVRLGASLEKISMCYLPPGPYETLRNFAMVELEVLSGAYLMHGATPMLGTVSTFLNDGTAGKLMSEQVEKFSRFPEIYYRAAPIKEIGLVYSRTSAENFAWDEPSKINDKFSGAFRALLNEHIHFDTFPDTRITREKLQGYRALFIPGGISLKNECLETLREYVRDGGTMLVTGKFTLIGENGEPLNNFAAADLLGVDFISGPPDAPYRAREYRETGPMHGYSQVPEVYLQLTGSRIASVVSAKNLLTPVSDAQVGIPELKRWLDYTIVKAHDNTETLANLYLPAGGAFSAPLEFPLGTPPGITLNHYGKGKVIYVAAPIEEHYERRRLPETRKLLKSLFGILLDNKFIIEVDAPPGIIVNLTGDGGRFFLHLLNYTGTMHEDGYAVEYIAPVHDIKIKLSGIPGECTLKQVGGGKTLKPAKDRTFNIDRLEIFDSYIIQPEN